MCWRTDDVMPAPRVWGRRRRAQPLGGRSEAEPVRGAWAHGGPQRIGITSAGGAVSSGVTPSRPIGCCEQHLDIGDDVCPCHALAHAPARVHCLTCSRSSAAVPTSVSRMPNTAGATAATTAAHGLIHRDALPMWWLPLWRDITSWPGGRHSCSGDHLSTQPALVVLRGRACTMPPLTPGNLQHARMHT